MNNINRILKKYLPLFIYIVAFVTTYILIMPAVSMNKETAEEEPGLTITEENSEDIKQELLNGELNETVSENEETKTSPVLSYPAVSFEETIENFVTSRIVAMSFCEPRSWHNNLSS